MPGHEVEALRVILNIREIFEFAGHNALADQVRQLGDQVERMAKDNASLSTHVQELELKALTSAINATVDTSILTRRQREVMTARLAFVREVERLAATGLSKTLVLDNLVEASLRGGLAPYLAPLAIKANDRSGGKRGLSKRSLERWCGDFAKGGVSALAPSRPGKNLAVPSWDAKTTGHAEYEQVRLRAIALVDRLMKEAKDNDSLMRARMELEAAGLDFEQWR